MIANRLVRIVLQRRGKVRRWPSVVDCEREICDCVANLVCDPAQKERRVSGLQIIQVQQGRCDIWIRQLFRDLVSSFL